MARISGLGYYEQALRLCIDGTDGGRVRGKVVSMRLSEPISFEDLSDFAVKLDAVMDEQNFPQSFQRKRGFLAGRGGSAESALRATEGEPWTKAQVEEQTGSVATIDIRVLTRQNTSWQGHVILPGAERPSDFKSVLELIQIISSFLEGAQ